MAFADLLRALPFKQDSRTASGRGRTELGSILAMDQDRRLQAKMTEIVMADDFLTDNYLSTDRRIPVTLLQTNACSPLATNAIEGNIWDNFSSKTYKELPSVGKMTVHNPDRWSPAGIRNAGGMGEVIRACLR